MSENKLYVFPDEMANIRNSFNAMMSAITDTEQVQHYYDIFEDFMGECGKMLAWAVLTNADDPALDDEGDGSSHMC